MNERKGASIELVQIEDIRFCMHCCYGSVGSHEGMQTIFCARSLMSCDNHRRADEPFHEFIDIRKLPVWK